MQMVDLNKKGLMMMHFPMSIRLRQSKVGHFVKWGHSVVGGICRLHPAPVPEGYASKLGQLTDIRVFHLDLILQDVALPP